MSYTKVEITDTGKLGGYSGRNTLLQESNGTFWTFIQKTADDYLYAAYSTDQGATWTIEGTAFVQDTSVNYPSAAIDSSDNIHVVYTRDVTYGGKIRDQAFYRKRTKGGSWGTEYNFTSNVETLTPEKQPRIVVDDLDHLHVVFADSEDISGTYRYYVRYFYNAGSSWAENSPSALKDVVTPKDFRGLVLAVGAFGRLHLFCYEFNIDTSAYRLLYINKWSTWSAVEEVSTDVSTGVSAEPKWDLVTETTRSLYVVWVSADNSTLYGRQWLKGVWQTQETVASLSIASPALAYDSEDTLWLLFQDVIDSKENIYMMSKPKDGSWTEAVNITNNNDANLSIRCSCMLWQKVPYFCKPNTGFYAVYAHFDTGVPTYKQYFIYDTTGSDPTVEWGVPEVTTQAADDIAAENGTYTATLNGTVVKSNSEPLGCKVLFQYGKSTDSDDLTLSDTIAGWKHTNDTFELILTGLDADTLYMFRAVGRSNRLWDYSTLEGLGFGMWRYFKTSEPAGTDTPVVVTDAASDISLDTATLNGTLTEDNGDGALCWFFWGDPAFIHFTHAVGAAVGHVGQFCTPCVSKVTGQSWENVLTGLLPATKYAYFSCAQNTNSLGIGDVVEFSTLDPQDPDAEGALGVVGSLQHEWRPGHYELRIGLGGFGKAEITIAAAGDDEDIDEEPDLQSPEAVEDAAPIDPLGWIVNPPFPPWMDKVTPIALTPSPTPMPMPVPAPIPPSSEGAAAKTVDWVKRYVSHTKRGAGSPMGEERGRTFYSKHRYKRHYRGFGITIGQTVWGQLQNLFHNTLKGLQGGAAADYQHLTTAQVAALHAVYTDAQAITAAKTIKLDDFTAPDDTTDLDASAAKHGLMPKADKTKLDAIEAAADVTDVVNVGAIIGGLGGINIETLTGDKTLVSDADEMYQWLDGGGANRNITLDTASAAAGDRFVIRHNGIKADNHTLIVKQAAIILDYIFAGVIKEFIFDGTNWISGSIGTGENDDKKHNVGIGYKATCFGSGTAIGYNTNASNTGVAVGFNAVASTYGVGIGHGALANTYGVAIGHDAYGHLRGTAIGFHADGREYGIAVGRYTNTNSKKFATAIGEYSECYRTAETSTNIDANAAQKNNVVQGRWSASIAGGAGATEILCAAIASERFTIRPSSHLAFRITVVARDNVANEGAMYTFEGLIKRDAAGNTVMSVCNKTVVHEDDATWDCAVTADDTNEALIITVTGDGTNPVQWAAVLEGVETHF